MFTKTIAAATASALLAGGAAADSDTAAPKPPQPQGQRHAQREAKRAARQAALAKDLGVSAEQLKAAEGALRKRNLDVRVAKGTLTVAQRSAILACKAAPLTCDRTNLPVRAKRTKKAAAKRKADATQRLDRRAARLAAELHLDRDAVRAALKERRQRG